MIFLSSGLTLKITQANLCRVATKAVILEKPGIRLFRQNNNKLNLLHEILRRYKTSIE